jgi:hypothetical protein
MRFLQRSMAILAIVHAPAPPQIRGKQFLTAGKGDDTMPMLTNLREAARKRAEYRRTLAELRNMPLDVALDLDLDKSHPERVAHAAVYGRG